MKDWLQINAESSKSPSTISLFGCWRLANLSQIEDSISKNHSSLTSASYILDGSSLEDIDTAGAMLALRAAKQHGGTKSEIESDQVTFVNFSTNHLKLIELALSSIDEPEAIRSRPRFGFIATLGEGFLDFCDTVRSTLGFIGATSIEFLRAMFVPMSLRYKELCVQLEIVGLNAIPIVFLVTFLIGVVIAYLTGVQIEKFGANIFIVDGIALAT